MVFSTTQLFRVHQLEEGPVDLLCRTKITKSVVLLGTVMQQNLNLNGDVNKNISSCYATLSALLRKLKHLAPFKIR